MAIFILLKLKEKFLNLTQSLLRKLPQSILNSVEQGEDRAKKDYEKALSSQLPSDLRAIVQRQADSVLKAHDYVRDMRDGQAQPGEKVA